LTNSFGTSDEHGRLGHELVQQRIEVRDSRRMAVGVGAEPVTDR
jgi:hypothetical protein